MPPCGAACAPATRSTRTRGPSVDTASMAPSGDSASCVATKPTCSSPMGFRLTWPLSAAALMSNRRKRHVSRSATTAVPPPASSSTSCTAAA